MGNKKGTRKKRAERVNFSVSEVEPIEVPVKVMDLSREKAETVVGLTPRVRADFDSRLGPLIANGGLHFSGSCTSAGVLFVDHALKMTKSWDKGSPGALLAAIFGGIVKTIAVLYPPIGVGLKLAVIAATQFGKPAIKALAGKSKSYEDVVRAIRSQVETFGVTTNRTATLDLFKTSHPAEYTRLAERFGDLQVSTPAAINPLIHQAMQRLGYPIKGRNYAQEMLSKMLAELELFRLRSAIGITPQDSACGGPGKATQHGERVAAGLLKTKPRSLSLPPLPGGCTY